MTIPPQSNLFAPPPPPDFQSRERLPLEADASAPDAGVWARLICWFVILGMALLAIVGNVKSEEKAEASATQPATQPAAEPADSTPALNDNMAISVGGRYAVAVHAWTKNQQADAMATLVSQLQEHAITPIDRIDVAIVSREVEPAAKADDRFATLAASHDLSETDRATIQTLQQINRDGSASISAADRMMLSDRLGWYGKLALVHGLPASDPQRTNLINGTHRLLIASFASVALISTAIIVGVVLLVIAIVLGATGQLQLHYRPAAPGSAYLEIFAIYMLSFLMVSLIIHAITKTPGLGWTVGATVVLIPVALIWPIIRGESWQAMRMHLGWHRGQGVLIEMGIGAASYLAALPLIALGFGVTQLLIKIAEANHLAGASPTHPIINFLSGPPSTLVLIYVLASVCAPILEETMFRGALLHHLRGRHGWWVSSLVVSFLFAAIHPQGWTLIPTLGALAMSFAAMREWRGSLIPSMTAHAINNGVVLTIAILMLR